MKLTDQLQVPSFWGWVVTWMAFVGIPCLSVGKVLALPAFEYGGIALVAPAVLGASLVATIDRWPNIWRPPLLNRRIYLRVSRQEIYARSINTGLEFRDVPAIGTTLMSGLEMVWAVGSLVRSDYPTGVHADPTVVVASPFEHQNLYVHDAKHAEMILHFARLQVDPRWSLFPSGIVVHLVEDERGTLTDLERHVFFMIASALGGGVAIHVGDNLNDDDIGTYTLTRRAKREAQA